MDGFPFLWLLQCFLPFAVVTLTLVAEPRNHEIYTIVALLLAFLGNLSQTDIALIACGVGFICLNQVYRPNGRIQQLLLGTVFLRYIYSLKTPVHQAWAMLIIFFSIYINYSTHFSGLRRRVSQLAAMASSRLFSFLCSYYLLLACTLVYIIAFNTLLAEHFRGRSGVLTELQTAARALSLLIARNRLLALIGLTCLAGRHIFLLFWVKTHNGYIDSVVPGPWYWPVLGNTVQAVPIKPAGLRKFHSWTKEFPVLFKYMVSSFIPIVYVHHPIPLRELLSLNLPKERKHVYRFLEAFTGEGLIVSSQPKWGKRRKLLGKAFHRKSVDVFVKTMVDSCDTFARRLLEEKGGVVDAAHLCEKLALDILLKCTFCLDDDWQENEAISRFVRVVGECVHHVTKRIYNPFYMLDAIYYRTPAGKEFQRLVKEARQFTTDIIELSRKRSIADGRTDDIVSQVYEEMEVSNEISVEDLASEVTTLLFAGHDTTAHGITFALALLSQHKYCWRRCKEEVMAYSGELTSEVVASFDKHFPYVGQCIKETLRLYPSVPMVARRTDRPLNLCGIHFPAQTWFCLNFYSLHRHQHFWQDPEMFDPDRFNETNIKHITDFTYLPFSAGPRNCIGMKLANATLALALVNVIRTFDDIDCETFEDPSSDIVLRPGRVRLRFIRHEQTETSL